MADSITRATTDAGASLHSERKPHRTSVLILGGCCILGILVGLLLGKRDNPAREIPPWEKANKATSLALVELLQKSDGYWESGRKDAAVEGYMQIISLESCDRGAFETDHKLDIPRVYNRVADFLAEQGNAEGCRDLVRKAARERLAKVTFSNPAVGKIAAEEEVAYERELDEDASSIGGFGQMPSRKKGGIGKDRTARSTFADQERMGITDDDVEQSLGQMKARGLTADQRRLVDKYKAEGMSEEECLKLMAEGQSMRRQMDSTPEGRKLSEAIEATRDSLRQKRQRD